MKKLFAVLLALAMVMVVFAEDAEPVLTFGQYADVSSTVRNYDLDADDNAINIGDDVTFVYDVYNETYVNYTNGNMGFSATVVSGNDFFATPRNYSVWYSMFDGKAKIYGGDLRETGSARLTSYIDGNGFSTRIANADKTGMMLLVKPIDGLTVSAFVPVMGNVIADEFKAANIGFAYSLPELATVVASYRQANDELAIGVDVKAIEGITLKAGFKTITDADSYVYISGGKMLTDAINLGLDADIVLGDSLGYGAEVLVSYAMAPYTFALETSFDSGDDAWYKVDGLNLNPYVQWDFDAGDIIVGLNYNTNNSTWSVPIEFELSY